MMKNKWLISILCLGLLIPISACSATGNANYDWGDIEEEVEVTKEDKIVTFHYGFNEDDFDISTGTIPQNKYTGIYKTISKNGRKVALNPMILKMFVSDIKYKITGYSTMDWSRNGIDENLDVYVLYGLREKYDVTFTYGEFSKTIQTWEEYPIDSEDIPTLEELGLDDNSYICGWTNEDKFENVTESFAAEAKIATMGPNSMIFEAEDAQIIDINHSDSSPSFSDIGSGSKSVYIANTGQSSSSTISMSFKTVKEIEVGFLINLYVREKNTSVSLFDLYQITLTTNGIEHVLENGEFNDNIKIISNKNKNTSMSWNEFEEMPLGVFKLPIGINKITITAHGAPISGSNIDYIKVKAQEEVKYTMAFEQNFIPLNPKDVVKGSNKVLLQAEDAQNIVAKNGTNGAVTISDFSSPLGNDKSVYLSNKSNEQKGYLDYTFVSNKPSKAMMSIMLRTRADVDAPILNCYDIFWLDENLNYTKKISPAMEGMVNEQVVLNFDPTSYTNFEMFMVGYVEVSQGYNTFRIMSDGLVLPSNIDYIELAFEDETVVLNTPSEGKIPAKGQYKTKFNAEDFSKFDVFCNNSTSPIFSDFGDGDKSLYMSNAGSTRPSAVELFVNVATETKAILNAAMILRSALTYNSLDAFDLFVANGENEYVQILKDGHNDNAIALNETVVDTGTIYREVRTGLLAEVVLKQGLNRIKLVTDGDRLKTGINFDYLEFYTKTDVEIVKTEAN